jgi:hypothetical protein
MLATLIRRYCRHLPANRATGVAAAVADDTAITLSGSISHIEPQLAFTPATYYFAIAALAASHCRRY